MPDPLALDRTRVAGRPASSPDRGGASGARARLGLVTGASGYVGGELVGRLLSEGWRVRVLTRRRRGVEEAVWRERIVDGPAAPGQVEVVEGDASDASDLAVALKGVDVAWYLLHSMGDVADFARAEREMAAAFAREAARAEVARIVYLGGLHPEGEQLSEHLESRAEVGEILMASGVPTAALQAGVVIGDGSASFRMLQGLAERLPGAFGPSWLRNEITPIAIGDLLHFLVRAAELAPAESRTFDVGGSDTLSYADMLSRYAAAARLGPRPTLTLPVMTPRMASRWIALVTRVPHGLVRPIVESILQDTVVGERDLERLAGPPAGGPTPFEAAVAEAIRGHVPRAAGRKVLTTAAAVAATALVGSLATDPGSAWYRSLRKPSFQPPAWAFPLAWTALYADIAWMTALARIDLAEAATDRSSSQRDAREARRTGRGLDAALALNLVLNAGWSVTFFRGRRLGAATAVAAALAASSADLVRRVGATGPERGVILAPYAAWTTFALGLTAAIATLDRRAGSGRGRRGAPGRRGR